MVVLAGSIYVAPVCHSSPVYWGVTERLNLNRPAFLDCLRRVFVAIVKTLILKTYVWPDPEGIAGFNVGIAMLSMEV